MLVLEQQQRNKEIKTVKKTVKSSETGNDEEFKDMIAISQKIIEAKEQKSLDETELRAQEIIREAKEQAEAEAEKIKAQILEEAQAKAKDVILDAKKAGYADGYDTGAAKAQKDNEALGNEIVGYIKRLDDNKQELISKNENEFKNLVFSIVQKVINEKLESDDSTFYGVYKKAIQEFMGEKWIKLTVSDKDYEFAAANSDYLMSMLRGAENIEISVLDGAPKGTCIVETANGIADTSVDSQLQIVERTLASAG